MEILEYVGLMSGFWELPMKEDILPGKSLATSETMSEHGIVLGTLLGHVRHTITTNKLDVSVFQANLARLARPRIEKWVSRREIERKLADHRHDRAVKPGSDRKITRLKYGHGLVSRFRSSQDIAAPSDANFGIRGTLASLIASAVLDLKFL